VGQNVENVPALQRKIRKTFKIKLPTRFMNYELEFHKLKAAYDALKIMVDAQANAIKVYEHTLETIKINTSKFEYTDSKAYLTCSSDKAINEAKPDPAIQNEASHNLPDTNPDLSNRYGVVQPVPQPKVTSGFGNPFAGTSWGS
jgi:hypothetical protein